MVKNSLNICYLIFIAFFCACEIDSDKYQNTPKVEFLNSLDSIAHDPLGNLIKKIQIEFYLIDGDGDVGLYGGMGYPYVGDSSWNYFSSCYYIQNGEILEDTLLIDSVRNFTIPFIETQGLDETLKANVFITYETLTASLFPYDSLLFSFYVVDRAFNKSNIEWTDTIVFASN